MLGLLDEASYGSATVDLKPGDGLVLYTDGVTEAESATDEFFTESRLQQLIETNKRCSVEQLAAAVTGNINTFTQGRDQADDITLMVVKFRPADMLYSGTQPVYPRSYED
jgi:sigma-B regulation protein RsbU (phosphoserine phosphatase)